VIEAPGNPQRVAELGERTWVLEPADFDSSAGLALEVPGQEEPLALGAAQFERLEDDDDARAAEGGHLRVQAGSPLRRAAGIGLRSLVMAGARLVSTG